MATIIRKCSRCGGKGVYPLPGGREGECWGCANSEGPLGHVVVRSGEDKIRHDADMAFVHGIVSTLRQRAMEIAPDQENPARYASTVKDGLWALARREPGRVAKMRTSVENGRMDEVIHALATYACS